MSAAREDWRREMAHSTQVEIERALSTAREAWSLNHKEELDNCASQVEKSLREKLQAKHDEEKRQLVNDALNEAQAKFRAEKRKLEDELSQRKVYRHFFFVHDTNFYLMVNAVTILTHHCLSLMRVL